MVFDLYLNPDRFNNKTIIVKNKINCIVAAVLKYGVLGIINNLKCKIINYLIILHNSVRNELIIYLNYAKFVPFKMIVIIKEKKIVRRFQTTANININVFCQKLNRFAAIIFTETN